jgi:hypothetical protein
MNEEKTQLPVPKKGRPQGSLGKRTLFARDLADKVGCDPVEFLLKIVNSDTIEVTQTDAAGKVVLDAIGKPVKQLTVVSTELRVQCATTLCGYMYPRLSAQHVQGEVKVPVEVSLPVERILSDPKLSEAMAELALLVASTGDDEQRAAPLPYAVLHD